MSQDIYLNAPESHKDNRDKVRLPTSLYPVVFVHKSASVRM